MKILASVVGVLFSLCLTSYLSFNEGVKKGSKTLYETLYLAGLGVVTNDKGEAPIACFRLSEEKESFFKGGS